MTDTKINDLLQRLEKYKAGVIKSKKKSKEFLVEAGVVTPKGDLTNNFKHLCIPQEQA